MTELIEWESFYVIVGSAAGALVGLQFVVMTLIAESSRERSADAGAAFATPTIIHFSVVLVLSAALSAPWHSIGAIAIFLGIMGFVGIGYGGLIIRRMRMQTAYRPVVEDWAFHAVLPMIAYLLLAGSALAAASHGRAALFGTAAAALLLLLIGIHNAWDAVVYHVLVNKRSEENRD
jgi:hypothetical protein